MKKRVWIIKKILENYYIIIYLNLPEIGSSNWTSHVGLLFRILLISCLPLESVKNVSSVLKSVEILDITSLPILSLKFKRYKNIYVILYFGSRVI